MTLTPGMRLGPYEVLAPLGAGGMGEVYRARDTRLARDVALKVLPEHLTADPDVRARFEREARTVSSLNHPHIGSLYDIGRQDGVDYLVMELVEGETLADRIARGPLPAADVLRLGAQIADALDRAHRSGVVHRDLKPGNVMLTRSGAKLLDFGLARATGLSPSVTDLTSSPTVTRALTAEGTIVGTFQYMSPEQLEGRDADARSDLWAFGCVLHEAITGHKAFAGRSQASLIAAILEKEPEAIAVVSPLAPPGLERLIRACLAKDPDQRIQTAHDAKLQLQWIAEGGSQAGVPAPVAARRRGREALAWGLATAGCAAALALGALLLTRRPAPAQPVRFETTLPDGVRTLEWPRLSHDGRTLAFVGIDSAGTSRIYVRPLDALEAHALPGTEGAGRPVWSPDDRYLAFIAESRIRKVPAAGGPPVTIAGTTAGSDLAWGSDDVLLMDGAAGDSLWSVPASGGDPKPATRLDRKAGDVGHGWPVFLPDGRRFLYVAKVRDANASQEIRLGRLGSDEVRTLGHSDGRVEFAPPHTIVFLREATLMAQRVDLRAGKLVGEPVPVADRIELGRAEGYFSVSDAGRLAVMPAAGGESSHLVWMDRAGHEQGEAAPRAGYRDVRLSPDGTRVAYGLYDARTSSEDIWVRDLARGVDARITFDAHDDIWPLWSPDGARLAYASNRSGEFRLFTRAVDGTGGEDSIGYVPGGNEGPTGWSPDGRTLLGVRRAPATGWDLHLHRDTTWDAGRPLLQERHNEMHGTFSPDGRWIAYTSSESGRNEVYVMPYPGPGGKWQVSNAGGRLPQWRADGAELFYQGLDGTLLAAPVASGAVFSSGTPVVLFPMRLADGGYYLVRWSVTADGKRVLLNTPMGMTSRQRVQITTDWLSTLGAR